ncbi:tRNA lysidine(34) synthetase TilS [Desulfovibrio sp. OttesenSCG-928-C06]|nr:tRNA lysidine(34) synthetase TilS [Desulfovibrio sp. OttesenSCG-928-C06]
MERFLTKELNFDPNGKELVLAYSGGADSKALFFIMLALSSRLGFALSVAHLDHGLRADSSLDMAGAREMAAEYGLVSYGKQVDVGALSMELKIGKEEAGRRARRQFFAELIEKAETFQNANAAECELNSADALRCRERWVVTAHQLNDLAEDSLMRLIRGGGWPALAGMRALDEENHLVRPLLLTDRATVEEFLELIGQDWIRDPMNDDQSFLRNRIRCNVLPLFVQENPSFLESMADLWKLARLDEDMFGEQLENAAEEFFPAGQNFADAPQSLEIPAGMLECHKAMRLRVFKKALESIGPGQPILRNLLALDAAWQSGNNGAVIQFPGNKRAQVMQGKVVFSLGE